MRVVAVYCGVQLMVLGLYACAGTLDARRELSREQHQDELRLYLQQNPRAVPSQALDLQRPQELRQFEFQQRQQQLLSEQHQAQQQELHLRQELKMRSEAQPDARSELRRFARERQQQRENFAWQRQQLQQNFTSEAPRLHAWSR